MDYEKIGAAVDMAVKHSADALKRGDIVEAAEASKIAERLAALLR
jgi:hypothetical protein